MQANIILTDSSTQKIAELLTSNQSQYLRIFIEGGDCSGFQYGFNYEETPQDDDYTYVVDIENDARLLVDSISHQYLNGAEIDYKKDLQGERFVINNPNAKTTCGCGSSFSIADDEEKAA